MFTTLKIFVDVVDARSFSRAATMNYLTPSAVSQRIQMLEEQVGCPLLLRDRKGVVVTEAGALFYDACRDMLERAEQVRRDIGSLDGKVTGRLCVGSVPSVGLHDLPPYVKAYLKQCPGVDLEIEYHTSRDIYRGLLERELDLGVVAYPARDPRFTAIAFARDEMVVITAPGEPLARQRSITLGELSGRPFVAFAGGAPTAKAVADRLRRVGVRVETACAFDNIETLKRAVEVGAGVSIVPRNTVTHECACGTLVCVPIREADWNRPVAVVHVRGRQPGRPAQEFIEVLRAGFGDAPAPRVRRGRAPA